MPTMHNLWLSTLIDKPESLLHCAQACAHTCHHAGSWSCDTMLAAVVFLLSIALQLNSLHAPLVVSDAHSPGVVMPMQCQQPTKTPAVLHDLYTYTSRPLSPCSELRYISADAFLHLEHGDRELADIAHKHCETVRQVKSAAL